MPVFVSRIRHFLSSEDGPTAVEYAVMLGLIVVAIIGVVTSLASSMSGTFSTVSSRSVRDHGECSNRGRPPFRVFSIPLTSDDAARRRMIQTPRPSSFFKDTFMDPVPKEVVWLVSFVLVEAALIDGRSLRVPNWLTYHFCLGGLLFAFLRGGSPFFLSSLAGAVVGLVSLLPLYAIGGMGAGDVKLMAGLVPGSAPGSPSEHS